MISIIDDDESVSHGVENLVIALGFQARTFSSAKDFLSSPDRRETACVISDVQMPNMSGLELQQYLVAQGDRTPIVFMTGLASEFIRARAMQAGAVCFLIKPFDASALMKGLQKALGTRNPALH